MEDHRAIFRNPFFRAAVELMKRDATFAHQIWQLCYIDRTSEYLYRSTPYNKLAEELGQKLAKCYGFDSDEVPQWLCYNVCDIVDYFSAFHKYGNIPHKASGLASFFRCIFLEHRIPSKNELDTILPVVSNLFFTILCPFFSLLGAISIGPIITGTDRIFYMVFGLALIIMVKFTTAAYKHPRGGYGEEQMRRRMGGRGIITPLRIFLLAEVIEGMGKGVIFYAVGTFIHEAYSIWELIIAFITGTIILFEIIRLRKIHVA